MKCIYFISNNNNYRSQPLYPTLYHFLSIYYHNRNCKSKAQRMTDRTELMKKYEKSSTFRKQMQKAQANYQILYQRSLYSGLPGSEYTFIHQYQGKNRMESNIYFIDGAQQYAKVRNIEKLTLALITKIPKPTHKYILVYLNDPEYSSSFSDLKTVLEIMPIEYFTNLVKILLVKPTFLEKAGRFFVFGTIPKFINSQIQNIDQVQELGERLVMDNRELFKYVPDYIREHSTKLKGEMHKTEVIQNPHQPTNIPNYRPAVKVEQVKYEIDQYDKTENGLPELFQLLVYYFQEHPEGLQEEGIFRKSANMIEEAEVMELMAGKHYKCLQQIKNPHIIANMIKKFLGNLKTPIIPFQLFHEIMDQPTLTPDYLSTKMKQLSQINLTKLLTLMFLLEFLQSSVVIHSNKNKMTTDNIAICFAPCIMWAKERSAKDIGYAMKSVQVLSLMMKNFQEVFGNRRDQKKLYRESYMQQKNKSLQAVMLISESKMGKDCGKIQEFGTDEEEQMEFRKVTTEMEDSKGNKIEQEGTANVVNQSKIVKKGIFTSKLKLDPNTNSLNQQNKRVEAQKEKNKKDEI